MQQDVIDTGDTLLIIAVEDVDALYQRFLAQGFQADFEPRNGAWGERYFHTRDPDGNRISFAKRIDD